MAFKIALIVAFCLAQWVRHLLQDHETRVQGFAMKPMGKPGMKGPGKPGKPCKEPIAQMAEEIPLEFDEAFHEMDEIREAVSVAAMDAYFKGTDPNIIISCFREQKGNYMKLGQQISEMVRKASEEIAQELGENYEKFGVRAEVPMKTIGITMKTLPKRMWVFIKDGKFKEAYEVMRESRRVVAENSKILAGLVREMAEEFPETAKRAEELAREIRTVSRDGCKAIGEAFYKCVEEGGPKNPVEDKPEDNAEVEEASEE